MMTNEDRVDDIGPSVEDFALRMGLSIEVEPGDVAGDLIAAVLHWLQANTDCEEHPDPRLAALDAARRGIGHYITETNIDYSAEEVDELGPDSFVAIDANCNGQRWLVTPHIKPDISGEPYA
ncbi:hypothetical protein TRICHSKD4_3691 [Roseibium sp. TrichSKD4]|uniref:hypothetical protein n=1 Tax=Roseibium sp. TrichSKD4 TaxID=744980 RepID=UPI0001E56B48|nr:hypothetical protein [Roseibium sp. TrichSKD4]EFO30116.1 hypothetical protein TRICHSKD4_3691 [Roseibium sp. TrichSKD4]